MGCNADFFICGCIIRVFVGGRSFLFSWPYLSKGACSFIFLANLTNIFSMMQKFSPLSRTFLSASLRYVCDIFTAQDRLLLDVIGSEWVDGLCSFFSDSFSTGVSLWLYWSLCYSLFLDPKICSEQAQYCLMNSSGRAVLIFLVLSIQ